MVIKNLNHHLDVDAQAKTGTRKGSEAKADVSAFATATQEAGWTPSSWDHYEKLSDMDGGREGFL